MKANVLESWDGCRRQKSVSPAEHAYAARPFSSWYSCMELRRLQHERCPFAESVTNEPKGASGVSCQNCGSGSGTRLSNRSTRPRAMFFLAAACVRCAHFLFQAFNFALFAEVPEVTAVAEWERWRSRPRKSAWLRLSRKGMNAVSAACALKR